VITALLLTSAVLGGLGQKGAIDPAQLVFSRVPALPVMMLGGGQVLLELTIDENGRVAGMKRLRTTPPLTDLVEAAVREWRFEPSQKTIETTTAPVRLVKVTRPSTVLVGAVFRPPSIDAPTLGSPAKDTARPARETPFPILIATPAFPLGAFSGGVVLVELTVAADGAVSGTRVVASAPPFDAFALDAAKQFRFHPAIVEGVPVASYAYILFGFPLPIAHEAHDVPRMTRQ
jgi:TonB family protein